MDARPGQRWLHALGSRFVAGMPATALLFVGVSLLLALTPRGSIVAPDTAQAARTSPPAATTLFGFNEDAVPSGYSLQRKLNAPARRLGIGWNAVEPTRGTWSWTTSDTAYSQMISAGLKPLIFVVAAPCWAVRDGSCSANMWSPPDPSFDSDWSDFVGRVAARYPQAVGIEIWSEPNLATAWQPSPDPARYTTLLKKAYTAVKTASPTMPVVSGGLFASPVSGAGGVADQAFLAAMYANGAGAYMDGVGDHPYPVTSTGTWSTAAATQAIDRVRAARTDVGAATPIWVTETGEATTSSGYSAGVTPQQQSTDLLSLVQYLGSQPDIPVALIHRLVDQTTLSSVESGFGVYTASLAPKPAACALSRQWHGTLRC